MDQSERKEKHSSLPPGYVTLAQLQERWLQKQREKEMNEKREKELSEKREKEMREKREREMSEKREKEVREKREKEMSEKHPSLPPDYVSLAQLQERWLQKQREKELSEKREKELSEKREKEMREKREREMSEKREKEVREKREKEMSEKQRVDLKKQQAGAGFNENQRGFLRNGLREKNSSIQEKGNGKEIVIVGFENEKNDYNNKKKNKKKKKKRRDRQRNKSEKGIEIAKEKFESETSKEFNGGVKGVLSGENSGSDGLKKSEKGIEIAKDKLESESNKQFNGGIKLVLSEENSGNDGLQGQTKEIVNRFDSRGGFSRNGDNRRSGDNRKREGKNRVRFNQLEETEVKLVSEKKMDGEKEQGIVNRFDSRGGFSRNVDNRRSGDNRKSGGNNRIGFNQLKETEVNVVLEKMDGKKERNWTWIERQRNGNNRGDEGHRRLKGNVHDVSKADLVEPELEKKAGNENLEADIELSGLNGGDENGSSSNDLHGVVLEGLNDDGSMPDKKADKMILALESVGMGENGEVGNGYRRYGNNGRRGGGGHWKANAADRRNGNNRGGGGHHRLKGNVHDVSKVDLVEPKLEKKADNQNLEANVEKSGLNGGDRNGLSSNDLNRVVGQGLNDNELMPDKKVDKIVLALESVGIGENGKVENGYRRYGNNRRQFGGGHWKANAADHRRYTRPGRFEGRWNMEEKEGSGMMWVKKEDKPGAYGDA